MISPKCDFEFCTSISKLDKDEWNSCIQDDHPFLQHEFLLALEISKSACNKTGWQPYHYVDKDKNDVIIKFVGFPNELASTLFINYVMLCVGFDFEPVDSMPSTKIH